jgi:TonB family protein
MSHRWLVVVSGLAHLAVAGGLFVSGVWRIERLEKPKLYLRGLAVMMPEPAPSGGAHIPDPPVIKPKKKPPVIVQPHPPQRDDPKEIKNDDDTGDGPGPGKPDDKGTCFENCGETKAAAPVCGDGALDASEQCDDGNTASGDGCSSTCRLEALPPPPPPAQPRFLAPQMLKALRISGETQVHPSTSTQSMMMRARDTSVTGSIQVCIGTEGSVTSATLSRSTGYSDYDQALVSAVGRWRYHPYRLNGVAVPACSAVTFEYSMH